MSRGGWKGLSCTGLASFLLEKSSIWLKLMFVSKSSFFFASCSFFVCLVLRRPVLLILPSEDLLVLSSS